MANKIIQISTEQKKDTSKEVFVDIAMQSANSMNQARNSAFKISKNVNVKAVQNSLHNIFTWLQGERVLNPEFGCKLRQYLYEGITDFNKEQIMAEIRNCISEWEPRVNLVKVIDKSNAYDHEDNTVVIDMVYTIPALNEQQYDYVYTYSRS